MEIFQQQALGKAFRERFQKVTVVSSKGKPRGFPEDKTDRVYILWRFTRIMERFCGLNILRVSVLWTNQYSVAKREKVRYITSRR